MKRPWPRIPIIIYAPRGAVVMLMLVFVLTALAGLFQLLIGDIDEFEARTGFFAAVGIFIIDAIVALACSPRSMPPPSCFRGAGARRRESAAPSSPR
jgi:hypothetical protein